jgi:TonB family protein
VLEVLTVPTVAPTGVLIVSTVPPGALVDVEGLARGPSPLRLARTPVGQYLVRVTWPRGARSQTIAVEADRVTAINWTQSDALAKKVAPQPTPSGPSPSSHSGSIVPLPPASAPLPRASASLPSASAPPPLDAPAAAPEAILPPRPIDEYVPPIPTPFPQSRGARIVVALVIDDEGRVVSATVRESSAPGLEASVLAAARRWRYEPATLAGVPVGSARLVDVHLSR